MPPPANLAQLLVQIQYPGMAAPESEVTRAWLQVHGREFDQIDFNVRVGDGIPQPATATADQQAMAKLLTQKRADVVAQIGAYTQIIEVKVRATPSALGQLQLYKHLWEQAHPFQRTIEMKVICRSIDDMLRATFDRHQVLYEVFP